VELITLSCLDTQVKEFLKQRWETQQKVVDIRIGRSRNVSIVEAAEISYMDGSTQWEKFHTSTMSEEMSECFHCSNVFPLPLFHSNI
jgi:hypothetical protein